MEPIFVLIALILTSLFSYKAGALYWRESKYCRYCGKYYDQPYTDPTDWRNDEEKKGHF